MNKGFFNSSVLESTAPASLIPKCGACGLLHKCKSPKLPVVGKGKKKILIVSEAPSKWDDDRNQLCANSDDRLPLESALKRCGLNMLRDCWVTSALICHPNGENPTPDQLSHCRPNLVKTIKRLNPDIIIPLGFAGVGSIIPHLWKDNIGSATRWFGMKIPSQQINSWVCPTFAPAHVHHLIKTNDKKSSVTRIHFNRHIRTAVELKGKPFDSIPDYRSKIKVVMEPKKAAAQIRKMISKGGMVAFDYETNRLKPDEDNARIISCSVCWKGKRTIAFPFHGEVIPAMQELLDSDLPKIASNLKFEDRWTRKYYGHGVRNWYWDTMLAAHVLDQRPYITSIKFQSFVLLGAGSYDDHITKYFRKTDENGLNAIHEIDLKELLIYNGMDSLLEYEVAIKQMKLLGYPEK